MTFFISQSRAFQQSSYLIYNYPVQVKKKEGNQENKSRRNICFNYEKKTQELSNMKYVEKVIK